MTVLPSRQQLLHKAAVGAQEWESWLEDEAGFHFPGGSGYRLGFEPKSFCSNFQSSILSFPFFFFLKKIHLIFLTENVLCV